jgi:serine protease AprX
MMKKIICLLFFALFCVSMQAQKKVPVGEKYYVYRLLLKDKKGSIGSLKHPEKFLSDKALARRKKQGLGVDSTDLPLSRNYLEALRQKGLEVIGGSKWNNTALVKQKDTLSVAQMAAFPFVKNVTLVFSSPDSVESVFVFPLEKDTTAAVKGEPYGLAKAQIQQLDGIRLHQAGYRGQGMTIAIIDGGFMNYDKIPALKKVKILGTRDFQYPYKDDLSRLLTHGTMVLSCMAAVDSMRYIGTAPEASYYLLRSEYGPMESLMEEDNWAMAAEYADSVGVDVINSSLGYANFDDARTSHKYVDLDGERTLISHTASLLAQKGIILVCSAGNEGDGRWKKITSPGDAKDVITVGAVDAKGRNTLFSSLGPTQDGRVKPDIMARGGASRIFSGRGINGQGNGTSFASPISCGVVACLWQALPNKTALQIIELIRQSGDRFQCPDNVFGYGIPDFWKAYQMGKQ